MNILLKNAIEVFIEGNHQQTDQKEADTFAVNFLIPLKEWRKSVLSKNYRSVDSVNEFAEKITKSPAIIVGRLHHQQLIPCPHLNGLRRRFEIRIDY